MNWYKVGETTQTVSLPWRKSCLDAVLSCNDDNGETYGKLTLKMQEYHWRYNKGEKSGRGASQ